MIIRWINKIFVLSVCIFMPLNATLADTDNVVLPDISVPTPPVVASDFVATDEILARTPNDTQCATAIFANALAETMNQVSESDSETVIQQWIYTNFSRPDVIKSVLACPEIAGAAVDETITFLPVITNFPGGREIVVNYETQPKILQQRLISANKRSLPGMDPSPRIGALNDASVWTNTDPAWYGIMVVEAGALDNFVGNGKNNTIALKYIADNIANLFPKNDRCTSGSALANDNEMVNIAMHRLVSVPDDTNDYYVAGDVNLQWISYLEIGLDVAITVATMGGGAAVLGTTKAARASRTLKNLGTTMRTLSKTDSVRDYVKISRNYARAADELKKIDRATDAAAYAKKLDEVNNLTGTMRKMEQTDNNVKQFKQASTSFTELNKYRHALRGLRAAQRGNIIARTWRAARAANTGGKMLNRGAKIARSSMKSGRIRDWLFQSTLKNAGKLAKLEATGGLVYGTLKFVGGMYDWTETSTGEFTSGIEFSPLLLLSADDLQGQENVVNHGMWLMWMGDSVSAADDDAAYLQAMDTAAKFYQDLVETQQDENIHPCNIDIYVVRPVIRNPGDENSELYYLIMNDEPWSTRE